MSKRSKAAQDKYDREKTQRDAAMYGGGSYRFITPAAQQEQREAEQCKSRLNRPHVVPDMEYIGEVTPAPLAPSSKPSLHIAVIELAHAICTRISALRQIEKALEAGAKQCVVGLTVPAKKQPSAAQMDMYARMVWGEPPRERDDSLHAQISPHLMACVVNEQIIELEGELQKLGIEV